MCRPNQYDVAKAILEVANENGFTPSEVRQYLQNSGRFEAVSGTLSAQIQQPLGKLRDKGYVAFDRNCDHKRNRPYIIKSRENLLNLFDGQERVRHEPTAAPAIDSRLQQIEQMLNQLTQKVDQLSSQIQPSPNNDHHSESAVSEMIESIMDNESIRAFYQALGPENQDRFDRVLHFASTAAIQHGRASRVQIAWGNNQPQHFRNVQSLVFAEFDEGRARPRTKMYAIPLVCDENRPITIITRDNHRSLQVADEEIETTIDRFRPRNLDHFLDNPDHYFSYDAGQQ